MSDSVATASGAVLPRTNSQGYYEIRLESIGGLGAHMAGQTLAEAAVLGMGLDGTHFSSYGSEKKGSAVRSFVRLADRGHGIRTSAPVDRPHLVGIFHEALSRTQNVVDGLQPDGVLVVNTHRDPGTEARRLSVAGVTLAVVDAQGIALEEKTRINTAMLGAVVRATEMVKLTVVELLTCRPSSALTVMTAVPLASGTGA
jgi:pyruvate ferredoxin oxidoreductase gamma subunit